jgi:hypothetical protein
MDAFDTPRRCVADSSSRRREGVMKRLAISAIAGAFFVATAFAGTAIAHNFVANTSLTIHKVPTGVTSPGADVVIYGTLRSPRSFCQDNMVIRLMKVRPGADKLLARDRTDREGEYMFVRGPRHDQTVYTRFRGFFESSYGHSHRCVASRSSNLVINVKG